MVLVPKAPVGLNFEGFLEQFCGHSEQMWKSETTILLERGLENQALEGLRLTLFCHLYVHVFMTCLFQDFCHNCAISSAFLCPLGLHLSPKNAISLNSVFLISITGTSDVGALGRRAERGGRRESFWEASGMHLGPIHLRFSPLVRDHTHISMDLSMDISMDISMGIIQDIH